MITHNNVLWKITTDGKVVFLIARTSGGQEILSADIPSEIAKELVKEFNRALNLIDSYNNDQK